MVILGFKVFYFIIWLNQFFGTNQNKSPQIMQLEKRTKYCRLFIIKILFSNYELSKPFTWSQSGAGSWVNTNTSTVAASNKRIHISALTIILSLTLISVFLSRLGIMSHLHPLIQDTKAARWVSRDMNRINWYIIPAAHLIQCHSSMLLYSGWKGLYAA